MTGYLELFDGGKLNCKYIIKSPSKLNLGLKILDKRTDGFHNLHTVFQAVDLYDKLTCELSEPSVGDSLEVNGPVDVPADSDNLILQALAALRAAGFELPALAVKLEKNIPTGAGLGGGSGNAAAIINLASEILPDFDINSEKILKLASGLGADVPFFLHGGTMLGRGVGEILTPLPDQQGYTLLVVPDYEISTVYAYQNFKKYLKSKSEPVLPGFTDDDSLLWKKLDLSNDFEPLISATQPLHSKIRASLAEYTEYAGLTGSGAAIYGIFEENKDCEKAVGELEKEFPGVKLYQQRFLAKNESIRIKKWRFD
ncbi:MAG: 4-(cytidine 5'-diphospho)-2-C-methyl-D-erythritol kinase [bacterium]